MCWNHLVFVSLQLYLFLFLKCTSSIVKIQYTDSLACSFVFSMPRWSLCSCSKCHLSCNVEWVPSLLSLYSVITPFCTESLLSERPIFTYQWRHFLDVLRSSQVLERAFRLGSLAVSTLIALTLSSLNQMKSTLRSSSTSLVSMPFGNLDMDTKVLS